MPKYLITGSKGQLGKEFKNHILENSLDGIYADIDELDISDIDQVNEFLNKEKPNVVINCSAYNNVDQAELEPEKARLVNVIGVKYLAQACEKLGSFLIHFSSNYIYDGNKNSPYLEEDLPNPLGVYAKSKYEGECSLTQLTNNFLIFRLSWLYGQGNQNFIIKFLNRVRNGDELSGVTDEISTPTWTKPVTETVFKCLEANLTGIYNFAPSGFCSRYDWAKEILKNMNLDTPIQKVKLSDFNLPAPRPKNAVLSNAKICRDLKISLPNWKYYLERYLKTQNSFNL